MELFCKKCNKDFEQRTKTKSRICGDCIKERRRNNNKAYFEKWRKDNPEKYKAHYDRTNAIFNEKRKQKRLSMLNPEN